MNLKIGDRVKIAKTSAYYDINEKSTSNNPPDGEGTVSSTDYSADYFTVEVDWDNGTSNGYNTEDLNLVKNQTSNKMQVNQLMKDAALAQAEKLAKANNTVTTLELKAELRKTDPEFYWNQSTVSNLMSEFEQEGKFTYTDNGTFRTYSLVGHVISQPVVATGVSVPITGQTQINLMTSPPTVIDTSKGRKGIKTISKTKAIEVLKKDTKGHFFKAVFTKQKDGKERTINCQLIKNANGEVTTTLGIVRVKEASLMKKLKKTKDINTIPSKSVIRSFNINNLKQLSVAGQTYKIS